MIISSPEEFKKFVVILTNILIIIFVCKIVFWLVILMVDFTSLRKNLKYHAKKPSAGRKGKDMTNSTGIIRKVDDLGRIVLPKELRKNLRIGEGTPMEIFASAGGIMLKKHYAENDLLDIAENFMESVEDKCINLEPEKTEDIRRHIEEIQNLLRQKTP